MKRNTEWVFLSLTTQSQRHRQRKKLSYILSPSNLFSATSSYIIKGASFYAWLLCPKTGISHSPRSQGCAVAASQNGCGGAKRSGTSHQKTPRHTTTMFALGLGKNLEIKTRIQAASRFLIRLWIPAAQFRTSGLQQTSTKKIAIQEGKLGRKMASHFLGFRS